MIVNLTQNMLSQLKCPASTSRVEYCSSETKGLLLEVRSSGAATWYLRYKVDSATKYFSFGPLSEVTLSQATKMALDMKAQIRAQGRDPRAEIQARKKMLTLEELWTNHFEPYKKPRARSFNRYEQLWRIRIKGKFGSMRLNQITRLMVENWQNELLASGLSPASCDHHIKLLKHMINMSISWGLFDGPNVVSRVQLNNPDNRIQHLMNSEQFERLMGVLVAEKTTTSLIFRFLLSSGARLNEALQATYDQLDLENRVWRIPARNSKSKKIRSVPLNDSAIDVLKQLDSFGEAGYLFLNRKTKLPYVSVRKQWLRIVRLADVNFLRIHDLRHGFASLLACSGHSLLTIGQILGHQDVKTSARYSHLSNKVLQDASNSASVIIQGAMQQRVQAVAVQAVPVPPLAPPALAQVELAEVKEAAKETA